MRTRIAAVVLAVLIIGMIVGCEAKGDYTARFLRYETQQDGSRVAVVSPVAADADEEQTAYTNLDDLEADDLVIVGWVGRDWDMPQWKPEREVVARTSDR